MKGNAVVYKVSYVDPDCDETSEGGRHYTGDCLRLEVYERHDGERTGYGCVERIDFDLHDGGDGIMEMLEYLTDWDADVQAERLGTRGAGRSALEPTADCGRCGLALTEAETAEHIHHPCGRCGMAEGAGAAGLCLKCDELGDLEGVTCPTCGEAMVDDHYGCEAMAALLEGRS